MAKSHYALVIRAALRWMLHVSAAFPRHEIHECKYSANKESRALFTSFTFLIFVPCLLPRRPPPSLCSFLRYSTPSLFHHNGSNFNPRLIATPRATRFRVYDLMNATPHLPPSTAVPRFFPSVNLRRTPYYKLFCAAQFKSIARNLVPRSFVLSSHFKSGTSATGRSIAEV